MSLVIKMFSKKRKLILIIASVSLAVAVLAAAFSAAFTAKLELTVEGEENITVEALSEFSNPKAKANVSVLGIKGTPKVTVSGEVDTSKTGSYAITYKTDFLFKNKTLVRKVDVVDTVPPVIQCDTENIYLSNGKTSITAKEVDVKYTAHDNFDGDITDKVEISVSGFVCSLTVSDSAGNKTVKNINIVPNDKKYPTLVLKGGTTHFVQVNSNYIEPGYSAKDNIDGDLTSLVVVTSNVDTSKSGEYFVEYTVSDRAGNTTKLVRKVVVYGSLNANSFSQVKPNGKTVYLTFDDGPGQYTEKLLGYLDQYGVKATFFVTNQFSKYQGLIKTIDQKGHTVGVHTLTHKWSIYKSEEAYYKDFNAMQNIIKEQTGKETKIFRFPGGTNNTISRSNRGIMTRLSNDMLSKGYIYFDWNVDCNDARLKTTQDIISSTISQIKNKQDSVVLMHDIKLSTVEAVPAIIEYGLANGYTFAPLDQNSPAVRFKPVN